MLEIKQGPYSISKDKVKFENIDENNIKIKSKFIPVNTPKIYKDEKKYVNKCLSTGWISSEGKYVKEFEKSFRNL